MQKQLNYKMLPVQVEVAPNQEDKIRKALVKQKGCNVKVRKVPHGPHSLLLRNMYAKRYNNAPNGHSVSLPFRHQDLIHNMKHKGGFLPLIAAALAPVIGGVAGGLIEREIAGSGLRRGGRPWWHGGNIGKKKTAKLYSIEKRGTGLYLNPWQGSVTQDM